MMRRIYNGHYIKGTKVMTGKPQKAAKNNKKNTANTCLGCGQDECNKGTCKIFKK